MFRVGQKPTLNLITVLEKASLWTLNKAVKLLFPRSRIYLELMYKHLMKSLKVAEKHNYTN